MSRIAKGFFGPADQTQALAHDSQRRRSPFQFGLRAVGMPSTLVSWLLGFRETGEYIMRNRVDIDSSHSRAIVREIGERLQSSLKEDRELPVTFRMQIERLRQLEGDAQANVLGPSRVIVVFGSV
jgi:hypothetical protein